jgi:hypothetical protein
MNIDNTAPFWSELHHPLVRNLAWCVFSPSLVAPSPWRGATDAIGDAEDSLFQIDQSGCSMEDWAWLRQLDAAPESLQQWMSSCHSSRLGFQFEHYWQFWWQHRHPEREYRFNSQLIENGQTLGELDALSWQPDKAQLTHTELAVKFYLGVNTLSLPEDFRPPQAVCWVGPTVVDRLDLKWRQLHQRQLQHLRQPQRLQSINPALPSHWHTHHLHTQLIMRGRLFYPVGAKASWNQTSYVNERCQTGVWLTLSQFLNLKESDLNNFGLQQPLQQTLWMILRRDQWFAPQPYCDATCVDHLRTAQALTDFFARHRQPQQLAVFSHEEAAALTWHECQRVFVVPDGWPS